MSIPAKNCTKRGAKAKTANAAQKVAGVGKRQAFNLANQFGDIAAVQDYGQAKLLKVKLECQRIARQLEIDEGKYIAKDSVREQGMALGAVVAACMDSLVAVLPGQLEGLAAAQMAPVIEKEVQKARRAVADAARGLQ
jgi:hypothetical protein